MRTKRHDCPVELVTCSHQYSTAASFRSVPSHTRPFVSTIQLASLVSASCTTTQSGKYLPVAPDGFTYGRKKSVPASAAKRETSSAASKNSANSDSKPL